MAMVHVSNSFNATDTEDATHLLNKLLSNYDKRFHPGFYMECQCILLFLSSIEASVSISAKGVTAVDVNLYIRSMGPISEMDMVRQFASPFLEFWHVCR
jgi:hypothetical protein